MQSLRSMPFPFAIHDATLLLRFPSQAIRDAFRIVDEVLADLSLVQGPDQVTKRMQSLEVLQAIIDFFLPHVHGCVVAVDHLEEGSRTKPCNSFVSFSGRMRPHVLAFVSSHSMPSHCVHSSVRRLTWCDYGSILISAIG